MGIVVRHGGAATIALGREAGIAQGQAAAAEIKTRQDEQLRDAVIGMATNLASGWRQRLDTLERRREAEDQRDFILQRDRLSRDYQTEDREDQQSFTLGRDKSALTQRMTEFETERGDRSKQFDAEFGLRKSREDRDATNDAEMLNDRLKTGALQREEIAAQAAERQARARKYDADALERQNAEGEEAKQREIILNAIDSEHFDEATGQIVKDGGYETKRAMAMLGEYGKIDWANTPRRASGSKRPYQSSELQLPDAEMIALTDPLAAMRIAAEQEPLSESQVKGMVTAKEEGIAAPPPPVTKSAQAMQAAMGRLPNLPQFTREYGGKEYFAKLERTAQQWRAKAPESVAAQMLTQRVEEERAIRQETVLPLAVQDASKTFGAIKAANPTGMLDDPDADDATYASILRGVLRARGISTAEYKRWASDLKTQTSPFAQPQGTR